MKIEIPRGRRIIFQQDGGPLPGTENAEFILSEDLTLSFSTRFSRAVDSSTSKTRKLIASVIRDLGSSKVAGFIGGEFQQLGFQTWDSTEPLKFSLSLTLNMENDARAEVVEPAIALTKICLPVLGEGGALIGPGPSVLSAIGKDEYVANKYKKIHCYMGNFKIPDIVMETANPTFSSQTDQNGDPIWAKIEVSFSTLFTASTDMLDTIMGGVR